MKSYKDFVESALGIGKNPLIKKPDFYGSVRTDMKSKPAENTLKQAPKYNKPKGARGPKQYGTDPTSIRPEFKLPSRKYPLGV